MSEPLSQLLTGVCEGFRMALISARSPVVTADVRRYMQNRQGGGCSLLHYFQITAPLFALINRLCD